jgi:hypothetical protein
MKGFKVKDMETCYKMGRGELMRGIFSTLESKTNFGLEPEVTAKLAMLNVNVKDCNISYIPRSESEGKKMRWFKHGLEAINEIFKYNILLPKKEYSIKTIEKNI